MAQWIKGPGGLFAGSRSTGSLAAPTKVAADESRATGRKPVRVSRLKGSGAPLATDRRLAASVAAPRSGGRLKGTTNRLVTTNVSTTRFNDRDWRTVTTGTPRQNRSAARLYNKTGKAPAGSYIVPGK